MLRIDGRPRPLRSLAWIPVLSADADAPPAPFGTNALVDEGRSFVLVIDDDSFRPGREQSMRDTVSLFLAELKPRDRVALVTMPYGGLKADFTTDRRAIGRAMAGIVGQGAAQQADSDFACRSRRTLESLAGLLDGFKGAEQPMTVVFFSSALAGPRRDAPATLAPGPCEITSEVFRQVGAAAGAARAHFYLIQPDDVMNTGGRTVETIAGAGFTGSNNPLEGLEHLAGVTGGVQLQLTTAQRTGLDRIARETSGYYVATFDRLPADRNGGTRRLELKTTRDDVTIRATPTIVVAKSDARSARPGTDPRAMLRNTRVFRELPLRGTGYVSRSSEGQAKILALVEPTEPGSKLTAAAVGVFDAGGRLVAQWTATAADLAGPVVMAAVVVPPGTYRLRMAAVDAAKRAGSADADLDATLPSAGPLTMSGLVLGLSRGGGFAPRFEFTTEPVAIGYLEIYGLRPGVAPAVALEIATTLNGAPLLRVPGALAPASSGDRHVVTAALPIGGLPPGDFVVRAVVGVEGQPAGRLVRTLRKVKP